MKKNWDKLNDDQRRKACDELIHFMQDELDQEIGQLAAGNLIDFFQQSIGHHLVNHGIELAQKKLAEQIDELNYSLDDLKIYQP